MCCKEYLNLNETIVLTLFKKIFFIIVLLFVVSGCISQNNQLKTSKIVSVEDSLQVEKELPECKEYSKIMNYAFSYVLSEFEKGYFSDNDILGAKAQLFLIKNKSKSVFAQNINNAEKSYNLQYQLAKKKKCNLTKFKFSPLTQIKNIINQK